MHAAHWLTGLAQLQLAHLGEAAVEVQLAAMYQRHTQAVCALQHKNNAVVHWTSAVHDMHSPEKCLA